MIQYTEDEVLADLEPKYDKAVEYIQGELKNYLNPESKIRFIEYYIENTVHLKTFLYLLFYGDIEPPDNEEEQEKQIDTTIKSQGGIRSLLKNTRTIQRHFNPKYNIIHQVLIAFFQRLGEMIHRIEVIEKGIKPTKNAPQKTNQQVKFSYTKEMKEDLMILLNNKQLHSFDKKPKVIKWIEINVFA